MRKAGWILDLGVGAGRGLGERTWRGRCCILEQPFGQSGKEVIDCVSWPVSWPGINGFSWTYGVR